MHPCADAPHHDRRQLRPHAQGPQRRSLQDCPRAASHSLSRSWNSPFNQAKFDSAIHRKPPRTCAPRTRSAPRATARSSTSRPSPACTATSARPTTPPPRLVSSVSPRRSPRSGDLLVFGATPLRSGAFAFCHLILVAALFFCPGKRSIACRDVCESIALTTNHLQAHPDPPDPGQGARRVHRRQRPE